MYNVFSVEKIEKLIGYRFKDKKLLERAFTHASASKDSYDRLEFLGDSFLNYTVARMLYLGENLSASQMTLQRSRLVSLPPLCAAIERLGLHEYIICSDYNDVVDAKGKKNNKTKSDIFESVLAAILLDGGEECAADFIKRILLDNADIKHIKDFRTLFKEEFIDRRRLSAEFNYSEYKDGFVCRIIINKKVVGEGRGRTKDEAKESASRDAVTKD